MSQNNTDLHVRESILCVVMSQLTCILIFPKISPPLTSIFGDLTECRMRYYADR